MESGLRGRRGVANGGGGRGLGVIHLSHLDVLRHRGVGDEVEEGARGASCQRGCC